MLRSFHTILSYGNLAGFGDVNGVPVTIAFHTILSYGNKLYLDASAELLSLFPHNSVLRKPVPSQNAPGWAEEAPFHTILSYGNGA